METLIIVLCCICGVVYFGANIWLVIARYKLKKEINEFTKSIIENKTGV